MGLFGALNIGTSGVLSHQKALDTVGHNIANADTEGYSRQRVQFAALPASRFGQLSVGKGTSVSDVQRMFDQQVENRLRTAMSTLGSLAKQREAYDQLEQAVNALGDDPENGAFVTVGGQLDQFFNELQSLSADPSSPSQRSLFVSRAESLTSTIRNLAGNVNNLRASLNETVEAVVKDVNNITKQIADLNGQIVKDEAGGTRFGQSNDLRDARDTLIRRLAEITNISTHETQTGAVDVRVGGDFLVTGNDAFELETTMTADRGVDIANVEFKLNGNKFAPREGTLGGLLIARDDVIPSFQGELDTISRTLIQSFNAIHSTGRGTKGLSSVTSQAFTAANALNSQLPISIQGTVSRGNEAGTFLTDPGLRNMPNGAGNTDFLIGAKVLFTSGDNNGRSTTIVGYDPASGRVDLDPPMAHGIQGGDSFEVTSFDYPIQNGSFKLNVRNRVTGITDTFDIQVDRDGLPGAGATDDTSVQDMVNDINTQLDTFYGGNSPVTARLDAQYRLVIESTEPDSTFHFSDDTSGFLAAAGLNTFFTGRDALSIGVAENVMDDPSYLATGLSAFPGDNSNVARMTAMFNEKLFDSGSSTIQEYYRGIIGTMAVESKTAQELSKNQETIATAAQNARERISGVNIDEESIDLIRFQRSFQAAARYLGVVDQMLQELMQIV